MEYCQVVACDSDSDILLAHMDIYARPHTKYCTVLKENIPKLT